MLAALGSAGLLGAAKAIGGSGGDASAGAAVEAAPPAPAPLLPPPSPRLRVALPGGGELSKLPETVTCSR